MTTQMTAHHVTRHVTVTTGSPGEHSVSEVARVTVEVVAEVHVEHVQVLRQPAADTTQVCPHRNTAGPRWKTTRFPVSRGTLRESLANSVTQSG